MERFSDRLKKRLVTVLSILLICFGISVTILGSSMNIGLGVAGGIGLIIVGLMLSKRFARDLMRYLDGRGFP